MASAMAEHIVSILHTRDGSIAAMHTIWNASAKDRKQVGCVDAIRILYYAAGSKFFFLK